MHDLVAEGVPARVVMAGTSKMRLHERFSKLPSRKTIRKPAHSPRYTLAPRRVVSFNELDYDDDAMDRGNIQYVNTRASRSFPGKRFRNRPHFGSRHVPIEQRLSVPQRTKVVYVNSANRSFPQPRRGAYHSNSSNNLSFNMQPSNSRGFRRGTTRGFRGRGFHQNNGQSRNFPGQTKTVEQLDRELDDYMKKGNTKHQKITF